MDFFVSFLVWPLVISFSYLKVIVGFLIMFIPYIIRLLTNGSSSLNSFIALFRFLKPLPFGREVFSGIASMTSPYSGSIIFKVIDFNENQLTISLYDYPWMRNPFRSLHAVALMNVCELASGIVMFEGLNFQLFL